MDAGLGSTDASSSASFHPAQVLMCRELFKLARRGGGMGGRPIAGTKFQQWYFFYTAAFWLYLRHVPTDILLSDAEVCPAVFQAPLAGQFCWIVRDCVTC